MLARQIVSLAAVLVSAASANPAPGCTKTITYFPTFTGGETKTVWTTTTTKTSSVDCGSCTAVTSTPRNLGVGPVQHFTTTVTATGPSTKSVYACATKA